MKLNTQNRKSVLVVKDIRTHKINCLVDNRKDPYLFVMSAIDVFYRYAWYICASRGSIAVCQIQDSLPTDFWKWTQQVSFANEYCITVIFGTQGVISNDHRNNSCDQ